jgi:hypothetical protein
MSLAQLKAVERFFDRTTVAVVLFLGLALSAATVFVGA